ncbi:sodium:solute symporter [Fibrobacterota bacterium]
MDLFQTNFSTIDWIIVCGYICVPLGIGIYLRKYISGSGDFIVAGRNLRLFLAVATLTGTEMGLVTIMYSSEAGFINGFSAFHIGVIECLAVLAIGLTGFIIYKLRESRVMTIPEYYEKRYNQKVRVVGGIVLSLGGILNMGLFLQAGANFMMGITGVSDPAMLKIFMSVMLTMVLVYTVAGGMVSLAINDFIQFIVLSFGMLIGSIYIIKEIGWSTLFTIPANAPNSFTFNPVSEKSDFGMLYVIFMVLVSVAAGALWQTATMRALAAKSPKVAQQLYACVSLSFLMRKVIPMLWGVGAFIYISTKVPHLLEQFQAGGYSTQFGMPIFISKIIPSGVLGFIAAGMFAAFMSTHDSYLLSWSSVISQDIISPLRGGLSDKSRLRINRITIVVIGFFLLIWGLWFKAPVSLWNYMAVTGSIYLSGAFTVIVAGLYWKKASSTGALIALLCGLFAILGLGPWTTSGIFILSDKFIGVATFVICAVAMVIGSLMFPDKKTAEEAK